MDGKEKTPLKISRADAQAGGLTRFFTGAPCRQGHKVERYVRTGSCVECNRIRTRKTVKAHYQRHRARILETKKDYYKRNAEAIKARVRARWHRNKQEQEQAALAAV